MTKFIDEASTKFDDDIKNNMLCDSMGYLDPIAVKEYWVGKLKQQANEWQHTLAYLTDEDVATPEGVRDWVMKKFEEQEKEHINDLMECNADWEEDYEALTLDEDKVDTILQNMITEEYGSIFKVEPLFRKKCAKAIIAHQQSQIGER